jgi:hypothetical protein
MSQAMERRLRQLRSRILIRSWAYRQRRHAHGAWYELRRVLAEASAAYVVSEEDAERLLAEGHAMVAAGASLEPSKVIVLAPADRVADLASARPVPVRLAGDVLAARHLVLVPFA